MNSVIKSKVIMFALGIASVVLIGSIKPAAAAESGTQGGQYRATTTALTPKPPVVRDHRAKPVVRDARTKVRDHTGGKVPASASKKKTPCLGNLCNVKVCAGSVCS